MKKVFKTSMYIVSVLFLTFSFSQSFSALVNVKVARIVDGDTIVVYYQGKYEKVRLIGIDTPESRNNYKTRRDSRRSGIAIKEIIRQGRAATRFVKSVVKKGDFVKIEFDVRLRDRYKRLLAYVYLMDGKMLNEVIIRSGYASVMTYPPTVRYTDRFVKGYRYAREKKLGLFK